LKRQGGHSRNSSIATPPSFTSWMKSRYRSRQRNLFSNDRVAHEAGASHGDQLTCADQSLSANITSGDEEAVETRYTGKPVTRGAPGRATTSLSYGDPYYGRTPLSLAAEHGHEALISSVAEFCWGGGRVRACQDFFLFGESTKWRTQFKEPEHALRQPNWWSRRAGSTC
jgi:hypothetical protein